MEKVIKIKFIYPDLSEHEFEANVGETILQVAHKNGVPLEGACEGSLACSTCHVVLEDSQFDAERPISCCKLSQKSVEEEDMLDLAFGVKRTSRLGCQVKLDPSMDGLIIHIPKESRNFRS